MPAFTPRSLKAAILFAIATPASTLFAAPEDYLEPVNPSGGPHAFSFSSGFVGDDITWPKYLLRGSPTGNGAQPGTFFIPTAPIAIQSNSGNLAFFNSNNLLTKPSTLLSGDVLWTDPKIGNFPLNGGGSFPVANLGFFFTNERFDSFGFDLALASVSGTLTGQIEFQVQDTNGYIARDTIDLTANINPQLVVQNGTFTTLNSPQPGLEARFRFTEQYLRELLVTQNQADLDLPNAPKIGAVRFFDLDLIPLHTFGGTTQLALDNFVTDDAPVPNIQLRTLQPNAPLPYNGPATFLVTTGPASGQFSVSGPALSSTALLEALGGSVQPDPVNLRALFDGDPNTLANPLAKNPNAMTTTVNLTPRNDIFEKLKDLTTDVQYQILMSRLTDDVDGIAAKNQARALTDVFENKVTTSVTGSPLSVEQLLQSLGLDINAFQKRVVSLEFGGSFDPNSPELTGVESTIRDMFQNLGELTESARALIAQQLKLTTYDPTTGEWLDTTLLNLNPDEAAQRFDGLSLEEYLRNIGNLATDLNIGDSGAGINDFYIDDSGLYNYSIDTWAVVDHDSFYRVDFFAAAAPIPEPATLTLLTLATAPLLLRRRHKS